MRYFPVLWLRNTQEKFSKLQGLSLVVLGHGKT